MTEEDQREMTTGQVVQAYIAGVIDADTFIWREGMEDWLTAFEIPQIGEGLRARGVKPPQPTAEAAPQDDTVVAPLAAQPAQARTPSHTGTWREPGRWAPGDDKRRPPSDSDISFDDVTVAMAPPQAQQLLEAATERALPSAPENEEDTIVATSAFRAGDNGPVDALLGALGQPNQVTAPADDLRGGDPWAAHAPVGQPAAAANEPEASVPDSEPPSSAKRPAALRRDQEPGPEPVDLFGAAALQAGSEAEQREQQIAAEQSPRGAPSSAREDVALTGVRHETSVLFSLDQLAKKEPPKPKRPQRPQESEADFLLTSSSPNTAHPGFAPVMTAPDFNAPPPPSVQSTRPSAPAPVAEKKSSNAGLWALLGFLVVGGLGLGGYLYVKQSAQTAPTFEPTPPPQAAVTVPPTPTAPANATTPGTATAPPPTAPVATDTPPAPEATDPKAPAAARRQAPAPPRPGVVAPKPAAPGAAPPAAAQPPPAAAGAPFNKEAAAAALASAAATAASTCAQPDGPTGSGKVTVTFSPTGRATQALVGGDFAGTSAGGCIAKVFRQATVPPFSGQPTTVAKTVRVP